MTLAESTKAIRKALKAKIPGLSVRMGTGTARAWIEISNGGDEWGYFTAEQIAALRKLGIPTGANMALIEPEKRDYWLEKLTT